MMARRRHEHRCGCLQAGEGCTLDREMAGRTPVPVLFATLAITAVAVHMPSAADEPSLDQVVKRVAAYVADYGPQLATIVAEEHYTQWVETEPGTIIVPSLGPTR